MDTTAKIVSGLFAVISTLFAFVFKGHGDRLDHIEEHKVDVSICKTIHKAFEKTDMETKSVLKDIQKSISEQAISAGKIEVLIEGIKESITKLEEK